MIHLIVGALDLLEQLGRFVYLAADLRHFPIDIEPAPVVGVDVATDQNGRVDSKAPIGSEPMVASSAVSNSSTFQLRNTRASELSE
jgi:hypothetical protein